MNKYPGQMVLEDPPNLDGLDFRSGVSHWYGIDEKTQPPDNAKDLHLDNCVRIFPQDIESCGFFVAIISRKPKPTNILEDFNPQPVKQKSIDPELCEKIDDEKIEFDNGKEKQVWRGKVKSESLETPSQADSSIKTFPVYSSLANDRYESVRSELTVFGSNLPWTQLVHRGLKNDKKIYMVSENVASIITHQDNKVFGDVTGGAKRCYCLGVQFYDGFTYENCRPWSGRVAWERNFGACPNMTGGEIRYGRNGKFVHRTINDTTGEFYCCHNRAECTFYGPQPTGGAKWCACRPSISEWENPPVE